MSILILGITACGGGSETGADTPNPTPAPIPTPTPTPTPGPVSPSYLPSSNQFAIGDAADFGFDTEMLQSAYDMAATNPNLTSLLMMKENHLLAEQYFNNAQEEELRHLRSVTKTVTAIIVGLALEEGIIPDLEITLGEALGNNCPQLSAEQSAIQLKHLLTMSSGFEWNENSGSDFIDWAESADPVGFLLARSVVNEPGTVFTYNSAAVHMISVMLDVLSEGAIEELVVTRFFMPLGITNFEWDRLSDGRINGSAGLQLTSENALKIGLLMLNNGRFENSNGEVLQIVPETWIAEMLTPSVAFELPLGNANLNGYGYLTWLGEYQQNQSNQPFYLAWGYAGQLVVAFPGSQLVSVGSNPFLVGFEQSDLQNTATMNLIVDGILASLL